MTLDIEHVLGEATVARLHDVIGDRTDAVVAVATPTGEMVWASAPGSQELFGRQQVDFAGHSQFDYLHPDDHTRFRLHIDRALRGDTTRYEVRAMTAEGTWLTVASVAWAVQTSDGPLIVSIAVPKDVA